MGGCASKGLNSGIRNLARAALVFLLLLSIICMSSCQRSVEAYKLMTELCYAYGIDRVIFSPSVKEGEEGYCPDGFLDSVFGDISESVSDYALLFISDLFSVGECAILVCYSTYDAIAVTEAALMRLELLRTESGGLDISALEGAFVERSGRTVILCALPDNDRARRLVRKII